MLCIEAISMYARMEYMLRRNELMITEINNSSFFFKGRVRNNLIQQIFKDDSVF